MARRARNCIQAYIVLLAENFKKGQDKECVFQLEISDRRFSSSHRTSLLNICETTARHHSRVWLLLWKMTSLGAGPDVVQ